MTTGADTPVARDRSADEGAAGGREGPHPPAAPGTPWHGVAAKLAAPLGLQVAAFVVSTVVVLALLAALGYDVRTVLGAVVDGAVGSAYAVTVSLTQAAPLMLTATVVWLAYQAGLFNVGGDGQLQVGGLAALVTGLHLPDATPAIFLVTVSLAAAMFAGAAWAAVAGVLRAYREANEVISTIMLNFVAGTGISLLIAGALRSPDAKYSPKTDRIPASAQLGNLIPGVPLVLVVALVLCAATVIVVRQASIGLRLRTVGLNRDAAVHAGLRVKALQWQSFAVSGSLAGIAGGLVILGYRYYIAPGWVPAWGLLGMVIAFLALRSPMLIPFWAVVLGMIGAAGPTIKGSASVPDAITTVLQGLPVVVLFLIVVITDARPVRRLRATLRRRTAV
jgi:general nucleoside transport system permease protein